jgi:hypothetical protein
MAPSGWDILGAIGAATGVPALGWQIFTWRRSKPRLVVKASNSFPTFGSTVGAHHFCISVTNVGGAPTQITSWMLRFPDGSNLVVPHPAPFSDSVGRIEPHGQLNFYVEAAQVIARCAGKGVKAGALVPTVTMTTGQEVRGDPLPFTD